MGQCYRCFMRVAWAWLLVSACGASVPPQTEPKQPPVAPPPKPEPTATGTAIAGRVMLDGEPVRDFGIVTGFLGGERAFHTKDGRFVFAATSRFADFEIVGHGFAPYTILNSQLVEGKTVDLGDIAVSRGLTITGHARDRDRTPLVGAQVTLYRGSRRLETTELGALARGTITTTTDAHGAFTISGIAVPSLGADRAELVATTFHLGSLPVEVQYRDQTVDLELSPVGGISTALPRQTVLRVSRVTGAKR